MAREDRPSTIVVLVLSALLCVAWALAFPRSGEPALSAIESLPRFEPTNAHVALGSMIDIKSVSGNGLWFTTRNDLCDLEEATDHVEFVATPDLRSVSRILCTPTALQWRHPRAGLPSAMVVRAAEADGIIGRGPLAMHTYLFADHGDLPVISISTSYEGLFGEEEGICVVGNGILHLDDAVLEPYANDPRWWKYPGNFHGRGAAWERDARMQLIASSGEEVFQCDVALRVNGQMTRGFPQHALRLVLDDALDTTLFQGNDGRGSKALVLRAAGNDQVKAMLRDAYQHALCSGLPFGTSKALTCVVYINGAYEGVYHLRQRMDEDELARRYGIPTKHITILEDRSELYFGDSSDVRRFNSLMARTEKRITTDPGWIDTLDANIDVEGFLIYMASQMVLGNMDWPRQNVKYWRYTGKPKAAPLDGRWNFLMGDSDLGFGANAPVNSDLFVKVNEAHVPVSRLFLAMMSSPELKRMFVLRAQELIDGPLSPARCVAVLDSMVNDMAPEMERHTARWRKPANKEAWMEEVELVRAYAHARAGLVQEQLNVFNHR